MTQPPAPPAVVGPELLGRAVDILVDAFYDDPLWSWAMPDPDRRREQHRAVWTVAVEEAARYPWVWLSADGAATSVWIPPGGTELSAERAEQFEPLLRDLLGAGATRVLDTFDVLEREHPHDVPHFYLSMLGTDPRSRGQGRGLALLADNLARIDDLAQPAYLESSNPANVRLYQRHGFEVRSSIAPPGGGPTLATMWREPNAPQRS